MQISKFSIQEIPADYQLGDHWLCATSVFSSDPNEVSVLYKTAALADGSFCHHSSQVTGLQTTVCHLDAGLSILDLA